MIFTDFTARTHTHTKGYLFAAAQDAASRWYLNKVARRIRGLTEKKHPQRKIQLFKIKNKKQPRVVYFQVWL